MSTYIYNQQGWPTVTWDFTTVNAVLAEVTKEQQKLKQKIENLRAFQIGQAGRIFGTKEFVLHKNYIVIYRVKNDQVQVLRIQHCAQNR